MANTGMNTSVIIEEEDEQVDDENEHIVFDKFDWKEKFAEEDVLELPVEHFGKTIKLKSYRYPPK